MKDTIRQNSQEMLRIVGDLKRLYGEADGLSMEMRRLNYRLPENLIAIAETDLLENHRRLLHLAERAAHLSGNVLLAVEEFISCEKQIQTMVEGLSAAWMASASRHAVQKMGVDEDFHHSYPKSDISSV